MADHVDPGSGEVTATTCARCKRMAYCDEMRRVTFRHVLTDQVKILRVCAKCSRDLARKTFIPQRG